MKYHQIIKDIDQLKAFVDYLPELKEHETFFLCLQTRKKYMPSLKSSGINQIKRFISSKEHLITKIQQLECPVGSYTTSCGLTIEDDGLVLYITPNPRDLKKATFSSIKALVDVIQNEPKNILPHSEVLTQIHKTKSRSVFVHFDVDSSTEEEKCEWAKKRNLTIDEIYSKIVAVVGANAITIFKTRGGCHILIRPDLVVSKNKNWYAEITMEIDFDQSGDLMLPVPGCCQGGFTPHFHKT